MDKKNSVNEETKILLKNYLIEKNCVKTLDLLETHLPLSNDNSKTLELMITQQLENEKKKQEEYSKEWTLEEIESLKNSIKSVPKTIEKNKRWKLISQKCNGQRTRKECYEKYKNIKNNKKLERNQEKKKEKTLDKTLAEKTIEKEQDIEKVNNIEEKDKRKYAFGLNSVNISKVFQEPKKKNILNEQIIVLEDLEGDFEQAAEIIPINWKTHNSKIRNSHQNIVGKPPPNPKGREITLEEMNNLNQLLFGDANKIFKKEWIQQGFSFNSYSDLNFGLIQHEGGPCGVLAVVQAFLLRFLLFNDERKKNLNRFTLDERIDALFSAISCILWQCGDKIKCVVVLISIKQSDEYEVRKDTLLEKTRVYTLNSLEETKEFLLLNSSKFLSSNGPGVAMLLFSAILSRGISLIKSDMDIVSGTLPTLIGNHNYCTQEMVNLLLVGIACTNVFDGRKSLSDTKEEVQISLGGIVKKGIVGFLTLFEAYDYMVVGDNLKDPLFPIWVICSESHYSVLFSEDIQILKEKQKEKIELQYYDGLSRQDEAIQLTVTLKHEKSVKTQVHDDLTPPLDLIIRTKWSGATVNWNQTEPIL